MRQKVKKAIELLSEVVTGLFGRQKGMKNRVCDGLDFFGGAAERLDVLRAFGGRTATAPVVLPLAMAAFRL